MKKVILIALLVLCGTIAQAAAVNWQLNVIQSSPDTSVAAGWVVQIYSSDVVFSYDAAKAGTITAWNSGSTVAAGTTFRATGSGTQDNSTTVSYYAVVYDSSSIGSAKNYIVSDAVSVTTAATGAAGALSFGTMAGTTAVVNKFFNSSWTSVGGGSGGDSGVPEPTSGLLLVVGGALLALRRKQK